MSSEENIEALFAGLLEHIGSLAAVPK